MGLLTLNRYILLDPVLLFFISGATYSMVKFRNLSGAAFSPVWWVWLAVTGCCLGGAISVKFVGLFVILLVGAMTVEQVCAKNFLIFYVLLLNVILFQLWVILGDVTKPLAHTVKHFAARALCLIALPVALYVAIFYVHLQVLYKT